MDGMTHLRPSTVPDPVSRSPEQRYLEMSSDARAVRAFSDGTKTSLLLSHTGSHWHERMQPGFVFTATVRTRSQPYSWKLWATLEVVAACAHERISDVQRCSGGHDPAAIEPGRAGWSRIKNRALLSARKAGDRDATARLAHGGWSVVDVALVDSGRERIVPVAQQRRRYRNAIEAELAEDNRYYEWLKLSAAQAGEKREPSYDELVFRARSSVSSAC